MKQLYQAENYLIYGHKDSANGKSILNFIINKTEKKPRQVRKTPIPLIPINNTDTS